MNTIDCSSIIFNSAECSFIIIGYETMDIKHSFGGALRQIRKAKQMSQEEFSIVSSRTYVSSLERGLKSPTLDKVEVLAEKLDIHPLTVLLLAYMKKEGQGDEHELMKIVFSELRELES